MSGTRFLTQGGAALPQYRRQRIVIHHLEEAIDDGTFVDDAKDEPLELSFRDSRSGCEIIRGSRLRSSPSFAPHVSLELEPPDHCSLERSLCLVVGLAQTANDLHIQDILIHGSSGE